MADKLISLTNLQEYKTHADAKYQGKLTAGNNISINNNTISKIGFPTFSGDLLSGTKSVSNNTLTKIGEVTLQPGIYALMYTCTFVTNVTGYRLCSFSINTTGVVDFGWNYMDLKAAVPDIDSQTSVSALFEVSATDYPNGRTFYFLAKQNCGSALTARPRCSYIKF